MKRLVLFLLLAGCAQQDRPADVATAPPAIDQPVALTCEPFQPSSDRVKRLIKSRDDWKRYAESLEKLLPATPDHKPTSIEP